jgi:protein deglycase
MRRAVPAAGARARRSPCWVRAATSYPGYMTQLGDVDYREDDVVQDGTVVTIRGPGTAIAFALTLVARLVGEDEAADLAARMLAPPLSGG